jgi:hypothetical protein
VGEWAALVKTCLDAAQSGGADVTVGNIDSRRPSK